MSVNTNITGQGITPTVKLNDKSFTPNKEKFALGIPNVSSNEKILTPIISETRALAMKNPASMMNNLVGLSLIILCIMPVRYEIL
jgi:hypothetical protein